MSATFEHPSLQSLVTPVQRERAENWLKEAYANGRISGTEFDHRIGQVITADNRRDLNAAFYGLVQVSAPSQALGVHPAYQPLYNPMKDERTGRAAAAFAHFSVFFFLWLLGPGLVYALSQPGGYARREAAKAFNFQAISTVVLILAGVFTGVVDNGATQLVMPFLAVAWFVLTIIGGAKAAQGENWRNPVTRVVKLEILPEK